MRSPVPSENSGIYSPVNVAILERVSFAHSISSTQPVWARCIATLKEINPSDERPPFCSMAQSDTVGVPRVGRRRDEGRRDGKNGLDEPDNNRQAKQELL